MRTDVDLLIRDIKFPEFIIINYFFFFGQVHNIRVSDLVKCNWFLVSNEF